MKPDYILETALYVDDLIQAEHFYTTVLGLELDSKVEGRHIFLKCGHGALLLFNADKTLESDGKIPTHGSRGPGHMAFAIKREDFQKWKDHLAKHNIAIESEVNWREDKYSLYFRDPSGNSIELTTPDIWGFKD